MSPEAVDSAAEDVVSPVGRTGAEGAAAEVEVSGSRQLAPVAHSRPD